MAAVAELQVDWRSLFDHIGVAWRDSGPNTSAGNVNIACPYCGDDPSFHLAVSEEREAYYCWRRPRQHRGRNAVFLLYALGIPRSQAISLLNSYRSNNPQRRVLKKPPPEDAEVEREWNFFKLISDQPTYLKYLHKRGFDNPEWVARAFDLRFARAGEWAGRILFPTHDRTGRVIGWTGRAVRDDVKPKYSMKRTGHQLLYAPLLPRRRLITVEGPFDALKINVAMYGSDTAACALNGKELNEGKLQRFVDLLQFAQVHDIALDNDTSTAECYSIVRELAPLLAPGATRRLRLPSTKDAGAMSTGDIVEWLNRGKNDNP